MAEGVAERLRRAVAAHQAGRLAEAEADYRAVLAREPRNADALNLLGLIVGGRGETAAAVGLFDRAVAAAPRLAEAHFNKATVLAGAGDTAGAEAGYRAAVKAKPGYADAWLNLGALLHRAGRRDDAIAAFRTMIESAERDPRGYFNLGRVLVDAERPGEAVEPLTKALALTPDYVDAMLALADAYADLDQPHDAIPILARVKRLGQRVPEALIRIGTILADSGDLNGALGAYEECLAVDPANVTARVNRGMACLATGALGDGWADYARRGEDPDFQPATPARSVPQWNGQPLAGKSILVRGDQSLGDEILYAGMVPDVAAKAARMTLGCSSRLVSIFTRSFPSATVVVGHTAESIAGESGHDFQSSLIDLGGPLRPAITTFPNRPSYIRADPERVSAIRGEYDRLRAGRTLMTGLSWHSQSRRGSAGKSIPLDRWGPVLDVANTAFTTLQYGDHDNEIARVDRLRGRETFVADSFDRFNDIEGLAARLAALDLFITVSTTAAHLAGALGVPTWVLIPERRGRLWYWFDRGCLSPWYPSVRIFRFGGSRSAEHTITAVALELAAVAGTRS